MGDQKKKKKDAENGAGGWVSVPAGSGRSVEDQQPCPDLLRMRNPDAPSPRTVLRGLLPIQRARSLRRHAARIADQQRRRVAERPHCAPARPGRVLAFEPDRAGSSLPQDSEPSPLRRLEKHSDREDCFSLEQILGGGGGGGGGWGLFGAPSWLGHRLPGYGFLRQRGSPALKPERGGGGTPPRRSGPGGIG